VSSDQALASQLAGLLTIATVTQRHRDGRRDRLTSSSATTITGSTINPASAAQPSGAADDRRQAASGKYQLLAQGYGVGDSRLHGRRRCRRRALRLLNGFDDISVTAYRTPTNVTVHGDLRRRHRHRLRPAPAGRTWTLTIPAGGADIRTRRTALRRSTPADRAAGRPGLLQATTTRRQSRHRIARGP